MLRKGALVVAAITLPIGFILSFANLVMFSDSPPSTGVLGPALMIIGGISVIVFWVGKKDG